MTRRRGQGEGGIERLPSGKYRAVVCSFVNGERHRASKSFATKADALARLRARLAEKAAAGADAPLSRLTLGAWLDAWLADRDDKAANTRRTDREVAAHLAPLRGVKLRDLTADRVEEWLRRLKTPATKWKCYKFLQSVLNAAVLQGHLATTPFSKLKSPRYRPAELRPLTRDELGRLLKAADELGHGLLFRVWADTGVRPGEMLGFQVRDFDPNAGCLSVRRSVCKTTGMLKEPKTARSRRRLVLAPGTAAALRVWVDGTWVPSTPLFATETGKWWRQKNFAGRVFAPVAERSGLRHVTPYTLRHTMATLLLQAGVSVRVVSERLGHEDIATTLRSYAHVLPGMQEAAAGVMGEILGELPTHSPSVQE